MKQGERQVGTSLKEIDHSHIARYEFAAKRIDKNDDVLDFGCGVGYGSSILAKNCNSVVSIDRDQEAIAYANEFYNRDHITYIVSDTVTFKDYFDVSICFEVIEHVDEPDKLLKQIVAATRTGGIIFLSTPNERIMPFSLERFPFHRRHYYQSEFKDLIERSGLIITGKFTQHRKSSPAILANWGGAYNMALCTKL